MSMTDLTSSLRKALGLEAPPPLTPLPPVAAFFRVRRPPAVSDGDLARMLALEAEAAATAGGRLVHAFARIGDDTVVAAALDTAVRAAEPARRVPAAWLVWRGLSPFVPAQGEALFSVPTDEATVIAATRDGRLLALRGVPAADAERELAATAAALGMPATAGRAGRDTLPDANALMRAGAATLAPGEMDFAFDHAARERAARRWAAMGAVTTLFFVGAVLLGRRAAAERRAATVRAELARLAPEVEELERLVGAVPHGAAAAWAAAARALPPGVTLSRIDFDRMSGVVLSGAARDLAAVAATQEALARGGPFDAVELRSSSRRGGEGVDFVLHARLRAAGGRP